MRQKGKGKAGVVWTLEQVPVAALKTSPIQPSFRVVREDLDNHAGEVLIDSIEKSGLRHPIDVERWKNHLTIIEGHRRTAVFRYKGWTHIPARVHVPTTEKQRAGLRAEIIEADKTKMTLNGAQMLEMLYKQARLGHDVSGFRSSTATRLHAMLEERFRDNHEEHEKLLRNGLAPDMFAAAARYVRAEMLFARVGPVEKNYPKEAEKYENRLFEVMLWIYRHKQTKAIVTWMDAGRALRTIAHRIEKNEPLIRAKVRKVKKELKLVANAPARVAV